MGGPPSGELKDKRLCSIPFSILPTPPTSTSLTLESKVSPVDEMRPSEQMILNFIAMTKLHVHRGSLGFSVFPPIPPSEPSWMATRFHSEVVSSDSNLLPGRREPETALPKKTSGATLPASHPACQAAGRAPGSSGTQLICTLN